MGLRGTVEQLHGPGMHAENSLRVCLVKRRFGAVRKFWMWFVGPLLDLALDDGFYDCFLIVVELHELPTSQPRSLGATSGSIFFLSGVRDRHPYMI